MKLKVSDLKVGERLYIGQYRNGAVTDDTPRISWLKATRDCKIISEYALDYIPFDVGEDLNPDYSRRRVGSNDYESSNILQFLNSAEEGWWQPTHAYDTCPDRYHARNSAYNEIPGFLFGFEDYELACFTSRFELPQTTDIIGGTRFELFNRKGIRAKPTWGLVYDRSNHPFNTDSFVDFWTCDPYGDYNVKYIDRVGGIMSKHPGSSCGLRPKNALDPDAEVVRVSDGWILATSNESKVVRSESVLDWDTLKEMMGLL